MQVFAGHTGAVQCGEFTPDGKFSRINVKSITYLLLSPSGKRIVTACADGTLMFWDPRSPTPVFKLTPEDARFDMGGITSLAVNPASTLAVVGGASGSLRVVSLSKGDVVGALGGHTEGDSVEAVQFVDLTGQGGGSGVVVTGGTDGKACIWDLSTMRLRATLEHQVSCLVMNIIPYINQLCFIYQDAVTSILAHPSPKGYLIVSGSADKTLRTWDARTGTLVREHKGHHGPILGAALGLKGEVVISAGDDGVCLVFTTTE